MDDLSLQQYYRLQLEEKKRIDEYTSFLETAVRNTRRLNLRGKSRVAYLQDLYREQKKEACRDVPEQKFLTAVFSEIKKQKRGNGHGI